MRYSTSVLHKKIPTVLRVLAASATVAAFDSSRIQMHQTTHRISGLSRNAVWQSIVAYHKCTGTNLHGSAHSFPTKMSDGTEPGNG